MPDVLYSLTVSATLGSAPACTPIAMAARTAVTTCLAIAFIFATKAYHSRLLDPTTLSISTKCREDATFLFMLSNARCRV